MSNKDHTSYKKSLKISYSDLIYRDMEHISLIPTIYKNPSPYIEQPLLWEQWETTAKVAEYAAKPFCYIYDLYAWMASKEATPAAPIPPAARGHALIGSLPEFMAHNWNIYQFLSHYQANFGYAGICKLKLSNKTFYIVSDPKLATHILNRSKDFPRGDSLRVWRKFSSDGLSEGEVASEFRNQAQDSIGQKHFHYFFPPVAHLAQLWVERLNQLTATGQKINLIEECERATLAALGESLFKRNAYDYQENNPFNLNAENLEQCSQFLKAFHTIFSWICARIVSPLNNMPLIGESLSAWLHAAEDQEFQKAKQTLYDILQPIYQNLLQNPETIDRQSHFYQLLDVFQVDIENPDYDHILDMSLGFIQAAFETSSKALGWTLLTLAQHPHIQAELRAELQKAFGQQRPASYAEIEQKVPYLLQVIEECLRLYPPFPFVLRDIVNPSAFEAFSVEKGGAFIISPLFMHRAKEHWGEDAEEFNPKRFSLTMLEDSWQRRNLHYFTFIRGAHACPGRFFAKQELAILLTESLLHFNFKQESAQPAELEFCITLQAKHPLYISLEKITSELSQ